ncbi:hypothetical protein SAMN04489712_105158 [Thermomonospora echinospora]|uniref:Uncharacterized protein n=1 Tax=Thermomonospora echinospora TaxID=1992 RepID=A0A1H6A1Z8_9ACTN|nr:hypothetical protein [Thermomonospora echinospora]SEG42759.1 hypothetical protein SAMN04489712_105158 [Thermomonospora echinospora]
MLTPTPSGLRPTRLSALSAATIVLAGSLTVLNGVFLNESPALADPCGGGGQNFGCGLEDGGGGSGGGGGGNGGGGGGGTGEIPDVNQDGGAGGPGAPNNPAQPAPEPATLDLAAQARSTAELPTPTAHTAPSDKTYVSLRTRLWVDGFVPVSTEPINVGNQIVVATATPRTVTWSLGETTVTCNGPGSKTSDACSHVFQRSSASTPGGAHQVTATITFSVTWTCVGSGCDAPGGTLDDLTSTSIPQPLVVSEIQTNSRP